MLRAARRNCWAAPGPCGFGSFLVCDQGGTAQATPALSCAPKIPSKMENGPMDYVRFGSTGLNVSRLCLGCMTYGDPAGASGCSTRRRAGPSSAKPWEAGINFFDTADMYSLGESEEVLGRALEGLGAARRGRDRHQGLQPDGARAQRRRACRASTSWRRSTPRLKRLGTDYVDLYIIHRFDPNTPDRGDPRGAATTSCAPARRSISAPPRCGPGSS